MLPRSLALAILLSTTACSMLRESNRRTLDLLDRELTPESTAAKVPLFPVALPIGIAAFAADLAIVHPVATVDDAWDDTEELLWRPRDESALRRVLFVPLATLATPVVFLGDWFGRWLLPITSDEHEAKPKEKEKVQDEQKPQPAAPQESRK